MTTECTSCNGEGKIPTTELHRGRRVDIFVPCWRCRTTGRIQAEQRRIDADKAEFYATRPDYDAMAHANIANGDEPF